MSELPNDVALLLVRELRGFQRELDLFPDDQSVWQVLPGVTNPAGALVLHVTGNLQHFVGAVLGGTGYVRNRADEFGRRSASRSELYGELQAAIDVVERVLPHLPAERLDQPFPKAQIRDLEVRTGRFLLHLVAHASFHLGQMGYLRRILTGDDRASGVVSLQALAQ